MEISRDSVLVISRSEDELHVKRLLVLKDPEFATIADHKFIRGIALDEIGGWRNGLEVLVAPKDVREITIIPTLEEWKCRYIDLLAEREVIKAEEALISLAGEDGDDDLGL